MSSHRRVGLQWSALLSALSLPVFCSSARGDLFVYDGFDYEPGIAALTDNDGGFGWDGPWDYRTDRPEVDISEESLEYVDSAGNRLDTTGNHTSFVASGSGASSPEGRRVIDTSAVPQYLLEDDRIGKDETSVWLSFLFQADTSEDRWGGVSLFDESFDGGPQGANRLDIGQKRSQVFSMGFPGAPDPTHVESDVPLGELSFVVVRVDFHELVDPESFDGEDELLMWVNPRLDQTPDDNDAYFLPFRRHHGATDQDATFLFDRIRIQKGYEGTAILDELRIGETYADVAPYDGGAAGPQLQAGDADQDLDFDQLDLVQVQIAAKYLTGQAATWGEGDWNGAPGGEPGSPPAGNGFFDQLDIVVALSAGYYLKGSYAASTDATQPEIGSRARGGEPVPMDAIYVPEPTTLTLLVLAAVGILLTGSRPLR